MTLHTKLWIAIAVLLLLVFSGSFLVSTLSAKSYLEQQISMKNADNASALALSLTLRLPLSLPLALPPAPSSASARTRPRPPRK